MATQALRRITSFEDLCRYLEEELDWRLDGYEFDDLTFEYEPEELGLKDDDAVKIRKVRQLRPLRDGQPWGIFFIEFEKRKLPVVVLRRILSALVVKKRQSANKSDRAAFKPEDLLFITRFGTATDPEIAFAHFHQEEGDLPALRVLDWDGKDTVLKLEHVAATLKSKLRWPDDPTNAPAWRAQWSGAFRHRVGHVIKTSDALAETLAALAQRIRDSALTLMRAESERGQLRKLYNAFKAALIHDLDEDSFADTYAQTITYGLLTAAISRTEMSEGRHGTALIADNVADIVPVTNPFLKEMLATFLKAGGRKGGINFDDLGTQDVVELLRGEETDLPAIIRDFGNRTSGEDPVSHFYEHFLEAYNKKLKVQRGVFYTPRPVVSYIVRSVDELLKTEFGLEDGLASAVTWGEMKRKHADLKIPEGVDPKSLFVQVLDPATGTATFLVEVIEVIYQHLQQKWKKGGLKAMPVLPPSTFSRQVESFEAYWNQYVPLALLPRLHGYELMMAPYAIAHMKIGLKLFETGYRFGSGERARIYLTNALEPATDDKKQREFEELAPALAHEARAVNAIKRFQRFTVVIGNPPYSYMSANLLETSRALVEPFRFVDGKRIVERGALVFERALQDDYVKFFALTFQLLDASGIGFVSMISNSAYLNSPHHRGMRSHIRQKFSRYRALDLHGDIKSGADDDENVFDIKTGVAIGLGERLLGRSDFTCAIATLSGPRTRKEAALNAATLVSDCQSFFAPEPEQYLFNPRTGNSGDYGKWNSVADIFPLTSVGIKTNRDDLVIGFDDREIDTRIQALIDPKRTTEQVKAELGIADNAQWTVADGRKECRASYSQSNFKTLDYRPFDQRRIYYHPSIVFNTRPAVMAPLLKPGNLALLSNRRIRTDTHAHFFVSNRICMAELLSSADNCNVYPLWNVEEGLLHEDGRRPNLAPGFLKALSVSLKLPPKDVHGLPAGLTPEDIFHYAYAVFHSPGYRSRYAEFLKIDFPRLPLTGNLELFHALARFGGELVALHLLESPKLDKPITELIGSRKPEVEKVSWSKNTVWVDKAQTTGFKGVREDVWNFHFGGYQICEKWLKDRKGRTLSKDDIEHYHRIVVALSETIRLMTEIDKVIDKHGGWPKAFA